MAIRYTDEFRRDAVRIATTSGLTRPQVSSDLGAGLMSLNHAQFEALFSGWDWRKVLALSVRPPTAAE